jgi:uncharacterized membrane protein
MILASLLFAFLAAALHIYIFTMESLTWTRPATWKRFGLASQTAAVLGLSGRKNLRAALLQGTTTVLAVVLGVLAVTAG